MNIHNKNEDIYEFNNAVEYFLLPLIVTKIK